jgi:hypothetical protein
MPTYYVPSQQVIYIWDEININTSKTLFSRINLSFHHIY